MRIIIICIYILIVYNNANHSYLHLQCNNSDDIFIKHLRKI